MPLGLAPPFVNPVRRPRARQQSVLRRDSSVPISTRYPNPSCAIMTNANRPNRLADEAQPLLGTGDNERSSHPGDNIKRPAWLKRPLCIYHAARAAALQLGNIYVFLVFVPLGLAAGAFNWSSILTSIFNFFAIIPLSAAVSDSSDKLSDEFGDLLGALINATFGNAVELIVILRWLHEFSWADRDLFRSVFWPSSTEIHSSPSQPC